MKRSEEIPELIELARIVEIGMDRLKGRTKKIAELEREREMTDVKRTEHCLKKTQK